MTRRARRTGSLFWGCSRYPKCDFTTSHEPLGAVHDADGGPVARNGDGAMCLACGATIELPPEGRGSSTSAWRGARPIPKHSCVRRAAVGAAAPGRRGPHRGRARRRDRSDLAGETTRREEACPQVRVGRSRGDGPGPSTAR